MNQYINDDVINVSVIEDNADMRAGISFIINNAKGFQCTSYRNAEEALAQFNRSQSRVVLMDIKLPGMDGIECTRHIKNHYPDALIMMFTVLEDSDNIFEALKAGATGYILKKSAGETLLDAIKDLLNGGAPMSNDIARKVVGFFRSLPPAKASVDQLLTKRESEILDLLAKGYSNKRIAEHLFVSVHTIRSHIYNIYDKLHVHNKVEALNKAGKSLKE